MNFMKINIIVGPTIVDGYHIARKKANEIN